MESNQKQEQVSSQPEVVSSPVITEPNDKKKIILISIISIIILSVGGFFAYKFSNNKDKLSQQVNTTLLPYEEIKPMTEFDYDKYLAQKITGFNEGGVSGYAGPMLLKLIKKDEGSFGIEAHMVPIPNIVKAKTSKPFSPYLSEIKINNVIDKDGNNILVEDYNYNKKVNQSDGIKFVYWGYPSPQLLGGTGTYGIIPSKKYDDISQVTGVVEMSLPINMQEVLITKKNKDKEIKQGQTTFKIKTFESNKIEILVTEPVGQKYGDFDDYISFYGANKEDIGNYGSSSVSNEINDILTTEYTYNFGDQVEEIELILFDKFITKSYNFTLTKHIDTPEIIIRNTLNDDQKQIVETFIDFKKIVDSKDELGFIEYLRKQVPEEDREDFEKKVREESRKDEINELFSFFSDFIIGDISPDIFYTNATTWEVENDIAFLEIKTANPGSINFNKISISFIKKNGNWYFGIYSEDTQDDSLTLDKKILGVWARKGDGNSTFEIKEKEIYYMDLNSAFTYSLSDKNLKIKYDGFEIEFTVEMPDKNTLILEDVSNGEKTTFNRF
jgi:hypothetical protein